MSREPVLHVAQTYHWREARSFLEERLREGYALEPKARFFARGAAQCWTPAVLPEPATQPSLERYVACIPDSLGRAFVILMQAGAVSIGALDEDELCATKSFKRYVVRGRGRAQETHLNSKGKSRYGSRLRLQNARRLIDETNERLQEWAATFGPPERVYYNAPVRLWPNLFEGSVQPPFEKDGPLVRIPLDLPKPTTAVLTRTVRALQYGRWLLPRAADEESG